MKLRWLTILLGLSISFATANAQVGLYGKFDAVRFTASSTGINPASAWYYGPGAGIYYDFLHLGPVALGTDLRGNFLSGNQQKFRSALFGLRLSAKPPLIPIRPYLQGSVGIGGPTHSGLDGVGTIYSNKFQYQVIGGLDFTLIPHLEFRVAEMSYGRMSGISGSSSAPVSTLFTISTGLVVRFP
jgi:hypothetical protein